MINKHALEKDSDLARIQTCDLENKTQIALDRGGIQTCDPVKIVARPGYKQTKRGWIPEEWEVATFKKIAIFNPKSDTLPDTFTYIDLESVKDGVLQKRNVIQKKNSPSRAQRLLEKNDVLFQTVRPYQKNNLFFEEEGNFVASTGYAQIRAKISSRFIFHLIHATYFNNQVLARCTGTSFPAISSNDLSKVFIKLPPLPEQQKIATILSTWDSAIAKQQQLIAAKQQFKKGLMQLLLTGEKRFFGFEGEWVMQEIGKFGKVVSGLTYKPENVMENGVLVLRSSNIRNGKLKYNDNVYVNSSEFNPVEKDDILICVRNGSKNLIGKNALITEDIAGVAFGAFMSVFRSKRNGYLKHLFETDLYRKEIHKNLGATINSINSGNLKRFKFLFPQDDDEQQRIASVLSAADKEIELLKKELSKLQGQKRGLMRVLLTGEKRVKL